MDRWRHFAAVLIMLLTLMPSLFAQKKADRGSGGQQEASPDSSAGAASSGILKQDFRNYRGQRKPVESGDLYMESFVSEYDGTTLTIDIGFNLGIDPRSIKGENILINDKPVTGPLKLSFNKEGTLLRLVIADYVSIPYSISIWGIRSYSGREMDRDGLVDVDRKDSFFYQADGWQRK
ncbi:MAG: hypothetical protein J6Y13_04635 [Treponema sp.]|nr:hypothetical protein [Treponema sp.]